MLEQSTDKRWRKEAGSQDIWEVEMKIPRWGAVPNISPDSSSELREELRQHGSSGNTLSSRWRGELGSLWKNWRANINWSQVTVTCFVLHTITRLVLMLQWWHHFLFQWEIFLMISYALWNAYSFRTGRNLKTYQSFKLYRQVHKAG